MGYKLWIFIYLNLIGINNLIKEVGLKEEGTGTKLFP
jgi:hypothetical protein